MHIVLTSFNCRLIGNAPAKPHYESLQSFFLKTLNVPARARLSALHAAVSHVLFCGDDNDEIATREVILANVPLYELIYFVFSNAHAHAYAHAHAHAHAHAYAHSHAHACN